MFTRFYSTLNEMKSKFFEWINWNKSSLTDLEEAEAKVLSYVKRPFKGYFVDIGNGWGLDSNKIWTIEVESEKKDAGIPLVLVHGFAAGVGVWCMNLDQLSTNRKVYAFDVLGFARSSRPHFIKSDEVEWQMTEAFERWRKSVGLNGKFILLGHSFGAYLSSAYSLQYPEHIAHMILADPWGIPSQDQNQQNPSTSPIVLPAWVKVFSYLFLQLFYPLSGLRVAGPWGLTLMKKIRGDIGRKYENFMAEDDADLIIKYLYHCNVQHNASGEVAFKALALPTGMAKYPIILRIEELAKHLNLSFIYGARSWNDRTPAYHVKHLLEDHQVQVHVLQGAGHHVYADQAEEFNTLVNQICTQIDEELSN